MLVRFIQQSGERAPRRGAPRQPAPVQQPSPGWREDTPSRAPLFAPPLSAYVLWKPPRAVSPRESCPQGSLLPVAGAVLGDSVRS